MSRLGRCPLRSESPNAPQQTCMVVLRIAARFFDRSIDTVTFKRGFDAHNNASFYRQLGKDPEQIVWNALDVLGKRFNLY
jgi:hypothetical protein